VLRLNHFDAGPDALPPVPRRQRRGSGCDHPCPRLLGSRNRLSGTDITHMTAELFAHFAYRRDQRADRILEPEDQEHQARQTDSAQSANTGSAYSQPRPVITDPNPRASLVA